MDVEEYLRRFKLASPPPVLKRRVLEAAAAPGRRWRCWFFAAAALLLALLALANFQIERDLRQAFQGSQEREARSEEPPAPVLLADLRKLLAEGYR